MKNNLLLLFGLVLLLLVAVCSILYFRKQKKQDIADHYNVCRDTLGNWAQYFPTKIPSNKWKSKRIFKPAESWDIYTTWGFDKKMVLNKKQIIEKTSSDYPVLSDMVKRNLDKIGITLEAWENCSVFPPAISQQIIKIMNGKCNLNLNLIVNS